MAVPQFAFLWSCKKAVFLGGGEVAESRVCLMDGDLQFPEDEGNGLLWKQRMCFSEEFDHILALVLTKALGLF